MGDTFPIVGQALPREAEGQASNVLLGVRHTGVGGASTWKFTGDRLVLRSDA